jgi:hypothetical protein
VLGYFIAVEQPPPQKAGGVTMTLAQMAPPPTNVPTAAEVPIEWFESPLGVRTVIRKRTVVFPEAPTMEKWRQPLIDRTEAPDFPQRRVPMRFMPSPALHNSPRGQWQNFSPTAPVGPQYDLIDFKYAPDFKLPAN